MTTEEAQRVGRIIQSADGECYVCAAWLTKYMIDEFPEHQEVFLVEYAKEHSPTHYYEVVGKEQ